jgi:hypothetical protein
METGVSDPREQDHDGAHRAQPWLRLLRDESDPMETAPASDGRDWSLPRKQTEAVAYLRPVDSQDAHAQKQVDIFAEAVAKLMQEELEPELVEAPVILRRRKSFGAAAKLTVAATVAALAALVFVGAFPGSQGAAEQDAISALPSWRSLKSALFPMRRPNHPSTLVVRDGSGPANQPLPLGVDVNAPEPGATVTIDGMPDSATLTVGERMPAGKWRVPARDISGASMVPPADFVGAMDLTIELHGSEGAALVRSFARLTFTSLATVNAAEVAAGAAIEPSDPPAPSPQPQQEQPQQQQQPAPPPPEQPVASQEPPHDAAPAAPLAREIDPQEVAGFIRRAQELLVSGDLPAARLLLLRATEAHDARAALLLAKTFDPVASKQFGVADAVPDPAQARSWYQKAEQWGAPEARRELDALASYTR